MARRSKNGLTPRGRAMRTLLRAQQKSGLTVRAFAAERGIPEGTLWYWRRALRERGVRVEAEEPSDSRFLPVRVIEDQSSPSTRPDFRLELRGGRRIDVPSGFSADALGALGRRLGVEIQAAGTGSGSAPGIGLEPGEAMAVLLVDLYDFSYKECAEIMGTPIGTVMSRISRARQGLKERLLTSNEEIRRQKRHLKRVK